MRTSLIIAVAISGSAEIVFGPTSPSLANAKFKESLNLPEAQSGIVELQLWVSDFGIHRRKRFPLDESQSGGAATPVEPTLPATPARETVVAEGASSAAASEPAQPAAVVVGSGHVPAAAAADDAADGGGEDDDETPLIPGGTPPRKKSGK